MRRWVYELLYRVPLVPIAWIYGDHREVIDEILAAKLVSNGRTLDLGCGAGLESIHLATKGFAVTGVDFSSAAIARARRAAEAAHVSVTFIEDDLTELRSIEGPFDVLLDVGAMSDLDGASRDAYVANVVRLSRPGTAYLLLALERDLPEAEVRERLDDAFEIETVSRTPRHLINPAMARYWLSRR